VSVAPRPVQPPHPTASGARSPRPRKGSTGESELGREGEGGGRLWAHAARARPLQRAQTSLSMPRGGPRARAPPRGPDAPRTRPRARPRPCAPRSPARAATKRHRQLRRRHRPPGGRRRGRRRPPEKRASFFSCARRRRRRRAGVISWSAQRGGGAADKGGEAGPPRGAAGPGESTRGARRAPVERRSARLKRHPRGAASMVAAGAAAWPRRARRRAGARQRRSTRARGRAASPHLLAPLQMPPPPSRALPGWRALPPAPGRGPRARPRGPRAGPAPAPPSLTARLAEDVLSVAAPAMYNRTFTVALEVRTGGARGACARPSPPESARAPAHPERDIVHACREVSACRSGARRRRTTTPRPAPHAPARPLFSSASPSPPSKPTRAAGPRTT
jgi:hypothetical protein